MTWTTINLPMMVGKLERLPCRYPGCNRTFSSVGHRGRHEIKDHDLVINDHQEETSPQDPRSGDGVYNYASNILKTGLWLRDFKDATREGDGERTVYLWKFMMPFFKITGNSKYALDAIFLHPQLNAILSERDAFLLKWNRTVSKKGGAGKKHCC